MLPKSAPSSKQTVEPLCDDMFPVTMATFDHLAGVRRRDRIDYRAEQALEEALNALFFDKGRVDTDEVARHLSQALKNVVQNPLKTVILFNCSVTHRRTPLRGS